MRRVMVHKPIQISAMNGINNLCNRDFGIDNIKSNEIDIVTRDP